MVRPTNTFRLTNRMYSTCGLSCKCTHQITTMLRSAFKRPMYDHAFEPLTSPCRRTRMRKLNLGAFAGTSRERASSGCDFREDQQGRRYDGAPDTSAIGCPGGRRTRGRPLLATIL